jgi:hypothetical protein
MKIMDVIQSNDCKVYVFNKRLLLLYYFDVIIMIKPIEQVWFNFFSNCNSCAIAVYFSDIHV